MRWKYLVVVLSAIVATGAATVVFHRVVYPLDPELAATGSVLAMLVVVSATLLAAYRSFIGLPLRRILRGAQRLAAGERDHRIHLGGEDEFVRLAAAINRLAAEAERSQADLEAQVAERTNDLRAVLDEVHERSRIAEEVNRQLEEVDRRRMQFLTNVSHDLRTPLNSILGFVKLLQDGLYEGDRERDEFLENARLSATHMLRLVNSVLDATQLEKGRLQMELEPVHAGDAVHDVLRIMEIQAREKGIAVRMESEGRAIVSADESKLRQVLLNLVANAIKFTDEGSVGVRIDGTDDHVRIEVADTGAGIPTEHLHRVFERFHQIPREDRSHGGTGLGLSISRQLVEMMGGSIEAFSDGPGRGARFVVELPAAKSAAGAA